MSETNSTATELRDEYHDLLLAAAEETATDLAMETLSWEDAKIGPNDTLLIVDMQIDFLPGGAFGVDEGDACIDGICALIQKFHSAGAMVIATRDYHPLDHCSFLTNGGPFPPHCVQGTEGSFFHPTIAKTLQPLLKDPNAHVVYKAFSRDVDSFGSFSYAGKDWKQRLAHCPDCTHCVLEWTGAYALFSSNIANDANAPPDVMSVLEKKALKDILPSGRIFACGLAYDFCVIDSVVNARKALEEDSEISILQDLTRAARIPGVGSFGSGFLTDPKTQLRKLVDHNIHLARIQLPQEES